MGGGGGWAEAQWQGVCLIGGPAGGKCLAILLRSGNIGGGGGVMPARDFCCHIFSLMKVPSRKWIGSIYRVWSVFGVKVPIISGGGGLYSRNGSQFHHSGII